MEQITNIRKLTGFLLLACIVQACHSATVVPANAPQPLMCYVCENCAKITKQTPLEACDAEFFDKSSTMQDPTTTTTAEPSTTTAQSTTTTIITTTIAPTTTTTVGSTEVPTTEGSITEAVPTAPTVGPPVTVPTPPDVGTVANLLVIPDVTISSSNDTESTSTVSYEAPKALPLIAGNYTYHCYSVQKKVNGVAQVERGCSRVTTMESVCGHLKVLNNGTELSKCIPCSNNSCNGSSALGVSMAALLFTLIAALLSRQ